MIMSFMEKLTVHVPNTCVIQACLEVRYRFGLYLLAPLAPLASLGLLQIRTWVIGRGTSGQQVQPVEIRVVTKPDLVAASCGDSCSDSSVSCGSSS
jgi:hypothetical protein